MLRKTVTLFVLVPLAVIIVLFAVANRQIVTVSFDPFSARDPAYAVSLPLFVLIFVLTIFGVFIGGMAAWLRQHKWRRAARRHEAENRTLRDQLDTATARSAHYGGVPVTVERGPSMTVPPPAA